MDGFPPRAPGRQSRDSTRALTRGPSAPAAAHSYLSLASHRLGGMHDYTALAPHDYTALAPHDFTALAPLPRARSLDLRPERGPPPRYANCGRAIEGHQSRRHTGYVAALCRDCHGCLRPYATRSSQHLAVCAIPSSSQHLTVCAISSPFVRGHPTRRASAGGEGPPQTTPLLSVGDANGVQTP